MADDDKKNLLREPAPLPPNRPASNSLVIRARKGDPLTKEQRTFNRLTKRIAALERKLTVDREKLDLLLDRFRETVAPVENERAERQIGLARALAAASARFALGRSQASDLREMLMDLFDAVFVVSKPDPETEAFYDEWADTSYKEEVRLQAEAIKRSMAEELRTEYGIKVDVTGDDHSPEVLARFLRDAQEKVRAAEAERPPGRSHRRRAPRREGREAQLRQHEALTRKSVRDIYLSLAKVLHPDMVADAAERSLREDYMKRATLAYQRGDLAALLQLELRWVSRDNAGPNALNDETLRIYIPVLQQQLVRMERAFVEQMLDPIYAPIGPIAAMTQSTALRHLAERAQALREECEEIDRQAGFVRHCLSKKALTTFVRDYFQARAADWDFDDRMAAVFDDD